MCNLYSHFCHRSPLALCVFFEGRTNNLLEPYFSILIRPKTCTKHTLNKRARCNKVSTTCFHNLGRSLPERNWQQEYWQAASVTGNIVTSPCLEDTISTDSMGKYCEQECCCFLFPDGWQGTYNYFCMAELQRIVNFVFCLQDVRAVLLMQCMQSIVEIKNPQPITLKVTIPSEHCWTCLCFEICELWT